jgi:Tfp pilus assembly protein PilV
MIALSILSVGLLSMVSFFGEGRRLLGTSHQTALVAQLAKNKMETLRHQRPVAGDGEERMAGTGMIRQWRIVQDEHNRSLWVITVAVFPVSEPSRSFILKSILYY